MSQTMNYREANKPSEEFFFSSDGLLYKKCPQQLSDIPTQRKSDEFAQSF